MCVESTTILRFYYSVLILLGVVGCHPKDNAVPHSQSADSSHTKPSADTLSFRITEGNNIVFQAVLDDTDTVDFYFDSGGTDLVVKLDAMEARGYVAYEPEYAFSLGGMRWDTLTMYPARVGPEEAIGHFGWNLFEDKVVELDYERSRMIVHRTFIGPLDGYAKLDIEYTNTLFCISGTVHAGGRTFNNRYLFDTGFQRAVVLDKDLRQQSNFPDSLPVLRETRLRNSAGTEFVNRVVAIDRICLGQACADQVPVQLLSTPNPAQFSTHILGNELLKRFNTILDFQNNCVYLKPNALMDLPYADAL